MRPEFHEEAAQHGTDDESHAECNTEIGVRGFAVLLCGNIGDVRLRYADVPAAEARDRARQKYDAERVCKGEHEIAGEREELRDHDDALAAEAVAHQHQTGADALEQTAIVVINAPTAMSGAP